MLTDRWRQALKQHYTAPLQVSFKQFRLGAMMFFTGLVGVYIAQQALPDSWQQELLALAGLTCAGLGFILAMLAQVRMLISRLIGFYLNKP